MMHTAMWGIAALLAVFSAACVVVVVREVSRLRRTHELDACSRRSLTESMHAYVGPVDRSRAPLTRPLRVLLEFCSALFGFPGLGWMVSGRIAVGLPLLIVVPAVLWMVYPLYISTLAVALERPLAVLGVLPLIATGSAAALGLIEYGKRAAA